MLYADVIKLVDYTVTVNQYGDSVKTAVETEVFCEVMSIGMNEFYQAAADGLRPEIKFVLANFADYSGQKVVKYKPWAATSWNEYTVIRTYQNGDQLEITCRRGVDE